MTHNSAFSDYAARLREFIRFSMVPKDGTAQDESAEDGFNGVARELFALQYKHNSPYRKFCEAQKITPTKIGHWAEIPAMPAAGFKEFDLTSLAVEERARVFYSSGTTGQTPSRHFHDAASLSVYEASLLPWFGVNVLGEPRRFLTRIGTMNPQGTTSPRPSPPLRGGEGEDYLGVGRPSSLRLRGRTTSARQARPSPPSKGGEGEKFLTVDSQGGIGVSVANTGPEAGGTHGPTFPGHLLPRREEAMRFVMLTPPGVQAPHSSLVHMFETIAREFAPEDFTFTGYTESNGDWSLDVEKAASCLQSFGGGAKRSTRGACAPRGNCPVMVMGTAFGFVHLLDFIAENKTPIKLPDGSRVLETGGYKGRSRVLPKAELHALITEWLGVPRSRIICEYGMSELSSQAYDHPASSEGRVFHFPPWARARIVSPETGREVGEGETGLIRIFDLANVRSVMAIQTEDLGVRRGDGFELIGRAAQAEPRGCSLMSSDLKNE